MTTLDVKFFNVAFALYFLGFITFSLYVPFRKVSISRLGIALMAAGLLPQTTGIIIRWATSEHVPLSNMFEYMSLMSWMAVLSLLILIWRYKKPLVGTFIAPLVFMLMVTASLLPKEVSQQLVPALQSYWITIHVTLAALGSGAFVVACAVSFIYLLKVYQRQGKSDIPGKTLLWWLASFVAFPIVFHFVSGILGFHPRSNMAFYLGSEPRMVWGSFMISLGMSLPLATILLTLIYRYKIKKADKSHFGSNFFALNTFAILLAALLTGLANTGGLFTITEGSALRIFEFFGVITAIMIPVFLLCYYLFSRPGGGFLAKIEFNLDLLDEINYKAITLGYPLYTVGALFAGAIWAEQAWGQFWGWDPKEVGSLIIWLFYTGFLHARYNRQWKGSRAAILAIFGFLMVLLTFFGNYFFGGQHSYA